MSNINPLKEEERLSALYSYHILDTAREDDFDQLTELAAAICQTPVALISLVDGERQWFKSSFGTDVEETDRCYSFCSYAIQDTDVMQVEDALEDQRFYDNPLVTGFPKIRFYAGMPLIDADGHALGSICVIDHRSRILSDIQTKALRTLANQVVDKLALRKKVYELEISKKALESSENALKIANDKLAEGYLFQKRDNDELQIANRKLEDAQYSLKDTQLKLNIAIESAGLGLFTISLDSDAEVIVNDQFAEMFGLSKGNNVNLQQIYDLVEPHYLPLIRDKIQKGVENGKTVDLLYKIKNQTTGEGHWIKGLGKVQQGKNGKPDSFIGINIDVTQEMEAIFNAEQLNTELRNKEIRLQNILDTVGEGIGITDDKGNIVYTNQRNREIFKFDETSMLKLSNSSNVWNNRRLDGSPMPVEEHPITKAIHTGEKVTGQEFMVQDGDGISKYLKMNTTPIKDSDGTITGAIGSFADITESYLLHEDLKQKEEKMRMAVASANLGTWHIDVETRTFIPSQRLKDLFGFHSDEDMPYDAAVTQIADSHRTSVVEAVEEAIKSGEAYELEYPIVGYHDKKVRWVRATGKLYTNPVNPHISHFSGTMADITEKKLDEQRRSDFIGMVSHDLRNPLTAIGGYNYILGRRAKKIDDDLILSSVGKISDQVKRMESMIEGFLEIARYGEGKIHLQKTNFDMSGLLRSAEDDLIGITNSHRIIFEPSAEIDVLADRHKLEQVIINFVNNAVKYSDPDTTIKVTCEEKEGQVFVSVEDQGMGIPPKDQAFIFDRFYRVERESTKNIKGFGIGLYICKEIIESHQGQIGVVSIKGQGSKFWFAIPL